MEIKLNTPDLFIDSKIDRIAAAATEELMKARAPTIDELKYLSSLTQQQGYTLPMILADGRYAAVMPLLFTAAIIVGRVGDNGYDNRWCYESQAAAAFALAEWVTNDASEPEGWHRDPVTGRRRPEGDKSKEYINP